MQYHIGVDHYAYEVLPWITGRLDQQGIVYQTYGSGSPDEKVSITEYIPEVCNAVRSESSAYGILVCGTGIGVDMGANKFQGIRAVFAASAETAARGKQYDNANVLCFSSWLSDKKSMIDSLEKFHTSVFEDPEGRRTKRMNEIDTWR